MTTQISTITAEQKENISSHVQLKYLPSQIQLIHSQSMNAASHLRTHVRLDSKEESAETQSKLQSVVESRGEEVKLPSRDGQSKHVIVKGNVLCNYRLMYQNV